MKDKFYITTAIAYTSQLPHIGNTYEAILTDSIARYNRLIGRDVYFLTGTDEHGQKIEEKANNAGVSPKEYVDKVAGEIRGIWDLMNVSYDQFIRTTDEKHVKNVQKIFKKLYDNGDIYKNKYEGLYCTPCESFYTASQGENGVCPECGAPLTKASEEAYFFKISNYADRLSEYIENNDFIVPKSRKNEMINNFIKPGLSDLCVSRSSFKWGIPVSFDDKHVIYVWIDALANYISALDFDVDGNQGELFNKYWPCDVHVIGKDILRFHTIYWPCILMALDLPLPKQVFGHPWLLFNGDKMSKSKGNVINAPELVRYFGVDAIRFYLLHEMPFAQDGVLTYELIIERYNSDLANILGNLVNRTLSMVQKYFDGTISANNDYTELDNEIITTVLSLKTKLSDKMQKYMVSDAIDEIFTVLRRLNKYIDETTPWILAKDEDKSRLNTVLYVLLESIRHCAIYLSAFIPQTAKDILAQINTKATSYSSTDSFDGIENDLHIADISPLFARIDMKLKLEEIEKDSTLAPEIPFGEEISIDDFAKSDIRVGTIKECFAVPKSDKLLQFIISDGGAGRQIVSGIAKYYEPTSLIGKRVLFVANLKPIKLRGVMSSGMLLSVESGGQLTLLSAPENAKDGDKVG
ncbi:MAG: methionine--tRNA ligase [Clostridia bacterium]